MPRNRFIAYEGLDVQGPHKPNPYDWLQLSYGAYSEIDTGGAQLGISQYSTAVQLSSLSGANINDRIFWRSQWTPRYPLGSGSKFTFNMPFSLAWYMDNNNQLYNDEWVIYGTNVANGAISGSAAPDNTFTGLAMKLGSGTYNTATIYIGDGTTLSSTSGSMPVSANLSYITRYMMTWDADNKTLYLYAARWNPRTTQVPEMTEVCNLTYSQSPDLIDGVVNMDGYLLIFGINVTSTPGAPTSYHEWYNVMYNNHAVLL